MRVHSPSAAMAVVSSMVLACMVLASCRREVEAPSASRSTEIIAASWDGGRVTEAEVRREAARLPPGLREQFLTPGGQHEFVQTLVDRKLLFAEAKAKGLTDAPEVQAQVRDLEQRLAIQALLAQEEKATPALDEAALKTYYDAHRDEFTQRARVHVARVMVRTTDAASKRRLEGLRARLVKREPVGVVAAAGDGPERTLGGDVGWVSQPGTPEADAALALRAPGDVSGIYALEGALAVVVLLERVEARVPPFDEARSTVEATLAPAQQRRAFDSIVARLRAQANVQYDLATSAQSGSRAP